MVRSHDQVRQALGAGYKHIFVDEFQDTDPVQAEIVFRIAAEDRPTRWQDGAVRPGSLFLVGDPKQAIYQFRGANAGSYGEARAAIANRWPQNVIQITTNFRSRPGILAHVNSSFEGPLSVTGQPGYVPLSAMTDLPDEGPPAVAKITVDLPSRSRADEMREAEAEAVATVCVRLIGNMEVRGGDGASAPLTPGGIALLAPTGTELWHYERAFEQHGLLVASQAGKGLFRRQEVQDLVALTRVLADSGDTLAFGALMRGPLIGLTEEDLLDVTFGLPSDDESGRNRPRFSMRTLPEDVANPSAKHTLMILRDLRRRSRTTTPALLLGEAIERLEIRPILAARENQRSGRAFANLDEFLERARPYGVKGLRRFARDINQEWDLGTPANEGRVDAEGDAIEIVTIHSSKGLEWPVVIPINTATHLRSTPQFVHRSVDDTLHWILGDVVPPGLQAALQADAADATRERQRIWYVACTRARDLLLIPHLPGADPKSWARVIAFDQAALAEVELPSLNTRFVVEPAAPNPQTPEVFAAEQEIVRTSSAPIRWIRPSDDDPDRLPLTEGVSGDPPDPPVSPRPVGAGPVRGLILHKLIEEILTKEVTEDQDTLIKRAKELAHQLLTEVATDSPDPKELAATALRTLNLPEISALRPHLIPEVSVYDHLEGGNETILLAGRADAIGLDEGKATVAVDWKSDISPSEDDIAAHTSQLQRYLATTGAQRGAIVYMTAGAVRWVSP